MSEDSSEENEEISFVLEGEEPDEETMQEEHTPAILSQGGEFYSDWVIKDGEPLKPRHRELSRQLASGHLTQRQIAKNLNYQEAWISTLKSHPRIRKEVARFQELMFVEDFTQRMKSMTEDALNVIEDTIKDTSGVIKPREKVEAARWLIEKVTGKATQTHDIGESTLASVLDAIDRINQGKPVSGFTLETTAKDVTGSAETDKAERKNSENPLKKWVSEEI